MRIKYGMKKKYQEWLGNNTDNYGRTCFVYAERFADMLLRLNMLKRLSFP